MRRSLLLPLLAGCAAALVLSGCRAPSASPPRPGDTVTPALTDSVSWTVGQPGQLSVRLVAQAKDGSAPRPLGLGAVPEDVNPVATVTFFKGEQAQSPVAVTLDHRC